MGDGGLPLRAPRELAAAGVTRWVNLVRVRQGYIAWLGLWADFSHRYGIERQQRPGWATRVQAAHRRLMKVVRGDPQAAREAAHTQRIQEREIRREEQRNAEIEKRQQRCDGKSKRQGA
jgi:hypothetical protein